MGVYPDLFDHAVTLTYDLFGKERIERFSDLFYEGEDFVSVLNAECLSNLEKLLPSREEYSRKSDFSVFVGEPSLFTIERIGFAEGNPYFYERFFLPFADDYLLGNGIYDLSPLGVYRDMSVLLDENHASVVQDRYDYEWVEEFYEVDGLQCLRYAGSRFHTDEEVASENEILDVLERAAREELRSHGRDFSRRIEVKKSANGIYYEVGEFSSAGDGYIVWFDAGTLRPLTPDDLIGGDWREYIVDPEVPASALDGYTDFFIYYFYRQDDVLVTVVIATTPDGNSTAFRTERPIDEIDTPYVH
ncbi:MAG: hypothetical protein NC084_05440 [Bacteroides sp.]|nr:hypothetical protein [Eubacterium sp.]MCM1418037.1 hypothetical protein [Roseburia sp.]MCM1462140.1 hypothetical protein [Bacteroides sp.]